MELLIYKDLIATTASVCTVLQFLTGILVCIRIVQNRTTGDISSFPFVSGFLSTCLWLRYGFLIQEHSIIFVNTIGATLFLSYIITFIIYSFRKSIVVRQFIICTIFLLIILYYIDRNQSIADAKEHLGIICCFVTILFFAAPLASFYHVIKMATTESLPFPIILANFIVSLQWLIYGFILHDTFIKIPNFMGCVLSGFQLSLFCIYPKKLKNDYLDI